MKAKKHITNGFKMTGDLYDDVKIVKEAISDLYGMLDTLQKECMVRDQGSIASELFIRINEVRGEMLKICSQYELILKRADIDQFGQLSKYIRPYLGF